MTAIYLDFVKSTPFFLEPNFKPGCLKMAQFPPLGEDTEDVRCAGISSEQRSDSASLLKPLGGGGADSIIEQNVWALVLTLNNSEDTSCGTERRYQAQLRLTPLTSAPPRSLPQERGDNKRSNITGALCLGSGKMWMMGGF